MKNIARKSALAGLGMAAVLGLTLTATAPAIAGTSPTAPCYLDGVRVGDMRGLLSQTSALTDDTTYVGDCGSVSVRVYYHYSGGATGYWSGWATAGDFVSTASYPYAEKGQHDSQYSAAKDSFR